MTKSVVLNIENKVKESLSALEAYLDTTDLKGYDPYDALNSAFLAKLAFNTKILRLVYTQVLKRLPINLRPLLFTKKDYNPKGLGLFLTGYVKLYSVNRDERYLGKIARIIGLLEHLKSDGYSGYCWGYNFNWQSRAGFSPKWTPTIVNTAFIAHAFLDAYQILGQKRFLEIARSSADFILDDLHISHKSNTICFSYTPFDRVKVHNANMLGAGLLGRLYSITRETKLLEYARKATEYAINKQRSDGSWYYAETNYQRWIDCHHTGFVLEGLFNYTKFSEDETFLPNVTKGLKFFRDNFFLENGMTRFYHNRNYPVDIHCPAQAIVTLIRLYNAQDNGDLLERIACWMIDHMQDNHGFFYYRKCRFFTNKIPYLRWSQSWAFHALTSYYLYLRNISNRV